MTIYPIFDIVIIMIIDEKTSHRITSLRFILAVLVVFIHNNYMLATVANSGENLLFNQSRFGEFIQLVISGGLACGAVPLFFLFTGYLQVKKNDPYTTLIKKRIHSLLIPYFIWIGIYLLYNTLGKVLLLKIAPSLIANPDAVYSFYSWKAKDWFSYIIGYSNIQGGNPLAGGQFWFVRDLFLFVVFSPVIIFLLKKIPFLFLTLLFIIYICLDFSLNENLTYSLLFYSLGLTWGIYNIDLLNKIDRIKWWELLILFIICFAGPIIFGYNLIIGTKYNSIIACLILLKLSSILINNTKIYTKLSSLSHYSFFLYAIHMPVLLTIIQKLWIKCFPMKNTFFCLFEYFGASLLIILIGTGIGILIRKGIPGFFKILTGGR